MWLERVIWCCLWMWWCYSLQLVNGEEVVNITYANECQVYGDDITTADEVPTMQFTQQVTLGLLPQSQLASGEISLEPSDGTLCTLFILAKTVMVTCGDMTKRTEESFDLFTPGDLTDLWLELSEGMWEYVESWDLRVVVRRGRYLSHLYLPGTFLHPPVNLRWEMSQNLHYYFNCMTGCLFEDTLILQEGDHTFFLRHDEDFVQILLNSTVSHSTIHQKISSVVVKASAFGPPGGVKKITAVWSSRLGRMSVVVDGKAVEGIIPEPLMRERQLNVSVGGEGGGLLTACDPRFQSVAGTIEKVTETVTDISIPSTEDTISDEDEDKEHTWLAAIFSLVLLNLLVIIGAVVLAIVLRFRSSKQDSSFPKENNSSILTTFSRQLSTRSSTRSQNRGSQRRNKDQNQAPNAGQKNNVTGNSREELAISETVDTPLTTHGTPQEGQRQNVLSPDALVKMELM